MNKFLDLLVFTLVVGALVATSFFGWVMTPFEVQFTALMGLLAGVSARIKLWGSPQE